MKEQAVITIKIKDGKLDVRVAFTPTSKTTGPMKTTHAAAMAGLAGIAKWAKGDVS
ncbi:MAG TPA: hypothetical protein VHN79_06030 [Lacunisphaera sp.]|nr:hypothetical protein [Lacunisphaera sp.]